MRCRDFERAWNELIDAEAGGVGKPLRAGRARRAKPASRAWPSASVPCWNTRPAALLAAR